MCTRSPWRSTGTILKTYYDKKADPPKLIGRKGDLVPNFVSLRDDGSTSSGTGSYCGSYTLKDGKAVNMMAAGGRKTRPASASIRIGRGHGR